MQNISAIAKKYSVDQKRVRRWVNKYDQLLDCSVGKSKKKRKLHSDGELCSQQLDNDVHLFLEEKWSEGRVVRNIDSKEKAIELAGTLGLQQFMASSRWVSARKKCWHVGNRSVPILTRRFQQSQIIFITSLIQHQEQQTMSVEKEPQRQPIQVHR